jgi:hypothetical protein
MRTRMSRFFVVAMLLTAGASAAAGARGATADQHLLTTYEPLLQFDPLEHFAPTNVESFITDSDLQQQTQSGNWIVVRSHAAPGDLPQPGSGSWRLDQDTCKPDAPIGGLSCYSATDRGGGLAGYGRVAREGGKVVLEYWYFYYDDVYSYAYPSSDLLWQAHEGDWESVSVVLSDDGVPLYTAYSQHCLGQVRSWGDTPRLEETHPIVHVAIGSHANYFSDGTHPINTACIPPAAIALLNALRLPLPVDHAFDGSTAGPPAADAAMPIHELGDDLPSWAGFPGAWGEAQYFHAPAPIGTVASGTSPLGPAFHSEWTDPLGTFAGWPPG